MIDPNGMYSGIRPKEGFAPISYFSLSASNAATTSHQINNVKPSYGTPIERLPLDDLMSQANALPNTMRNVLPCKGASDSVKFGRFERDKTAFMYPPTGYARNQPIGLAYDFNKPIDTPIMPIAGFYNQDMTNTLGGLK